MQDQLQVENGMMQLQRFHTSELHTVSNGKPAVGVRICVTGHVEQDTEDGQHWKGVPDRAQIQTDQDCHADMN